MSDNTQNQIEQGNSNPARSEVLSPTAAPQGSMTAAQAALARAQAARAHDANRPLPNPSPNQGPSRTAGPVSRRYEPSLLDEITEELRAQDYLTFIFLAHGSSGCEHDSADEWFPALDAAVRLALDLMFGASPSGRRLQSFRDPQEDLPDEATRGATIAAVQSCLERLRRRKDIHFVLAWYIEGADKPHFDLVGVSEDKVFEQIGDFLGEEVKAHLNC
ncbi:hypothetical protein ACFL5Q_04645 [Planctomycetota bacterium]